MTMYRYRGTMVTALPLKTGDVILHPGKSVELPEDLDAVRTLAAKGLLVADSPEGQRAKDEGQSEEAGNTDAPEVGEDGAEGNIPLNPPSKGDLTDGTPSGSSSGGRKSKQGA